MREPCAQDLITGKIHYFFFEIFFVGYFLGTYKVKQVTDRHWGLSRQPKFNVRKEIKYAQCIINLPKASIATLVVQKVASLAFL